MQRYKKYFDKHNMKYKVDLYCVCWNEIKILPFVIDYWKKFVNHAYVYDNGSNDGTIEYLQQYDWVTVTPFESDGCNDKIIMNIKNNAWKNNTDADYICVCDIDECLYAKDIEKSLDYCQKNNVDIISPSWNDIFYWEFPNKQDTSLLHENANGLLYMDNTQCHKSILFKNGSVKEMNYDVGCHHCSPIHNGNILICTNHENNLFTLYHCKNLGIDYTYERCKILENRRSDLNRKMGWGIHYNVSKNEIIERFKAAIE